MDAEIDSRLKKYINSVEVSHFDAVHCAPGSSSDIPDDGGNLRLVVLGVKNHHQSSRPNSEGMAEAKNILNYRGPLRVFIEIQLYFWLQIAVPLKVFAMRCDEKLLGNKS